ncbi:TPA: hypothetical protein QDC20_000469 [Burkholderia aenigmatica]|uniref:hypothetical protein n=1 Tax=Burkholderia sp. AU45251 TaxID=3059204 RepID=UPI00264A59E6|nr:hypothetical protein [Burkholderia sp. AU45251]HDR9482329.1 hypothetical protein [Burkholderia aenigmatica]MDN7515033.1 hypothetical protein [Burkholderia sp. AU45251]HDR9514635.1 hypothetical protein [Burkholderia aenigmatica]HDR9590700.1 hypothetical protein [Burkholderia aenigmatica]HDR9599856.1 hypothetical protein [Burkholderia aenigmatica]
MKSSYLQRIQACLRRFRIFKLADGTGGDRYMVRVASLFHLQSRRQEMERSSSALGGVVSERALGDAHRQPLAVPRRKQ